MNPEVQKALDDATATATAMNSEFFYWMAIAIMLLIHAGFLAYEMGASRSKNVLATSMKNLLTLGVVIATFFFFGWFLYNSMPTGVPRMDALAQGALPWSENMGPNNLDSASGVFFGAFALFAATTASIMSGAVLERIRTSAFVILAVVLGSAVWIIGAAWGWHPAGWLITKWGLHDVGAAGCVHLIAGMFTLGVLLHLGPRIGRFAANGSPITIRPHNLPLTMLGLMLIFVGFFGFLMGCLIYTSDGYTTIAGTPTNVSAFAFNTLMGLGAGIIGAYIASRGEPFWTISGGLAGVIAVAPGLDLYHPAVAFVVAIVGGMLIPYTGKLLERFKIDDVVGAVSVHAGMGAYGLVACGLLLSGYPTPSGVDTSLLGQVGSVAVFAALGFVPGYVLAFALKKMGMLRIPAEVEMQGLDISEVPATAYPEAGSLPHTPAPPGIPMPSGGGAMREPATVHRQSDV